MKMIFRLTILLMTLTYGVHVFSQNISNTTINTCSTVIYDDGGPSGDYTDGNSYVMTICSDNGGTIYGLLDMFAFGADPFGDPDERIVVYDGTGTGGAVLWDSDVDGVGTVITSSGTCLTIEFQSVVSFFCSGGCPGPGFEFTVTCIQPETCNDGILNNGEVQIDCGGPNCSPCYQFTACSANVVQNGDFETVDVFGCANNTDSEIHSNATSVEGWFGTTEESGPQGGITPDYWTIAGCGISPNINGSVGPCNSGQGALGFFPAREEVQNILALTMIAGKEYCLSVDVAASGSGATSDLFFWFHSQIFTNGTGIYDLVADNGGGVNIVTGPIGATPQIVNDPNHVFQNACEEFVGSFCATGGETNLVVGGSYATGLAYLIIDNLEVKEACPLTFDSQITASGVPDCAGSCVDLFVETSNQAGGCEVTNDFTFQWYQDGSIMAGQTNDTLLSVCPTSNTTYSVEITYSAGCSSITKTEDQTVITFNCSSFSVVATAAPSTICEGDCTDLTATPSPVGSYTYSWNEQGNATVLGTTDVINVCPIVTTTYEVTVDDGTDQVTQTVVVTVTPTPAAPSAGADATYCIGDAILDLTASTGSSGTLNWYSDAALTTNIGTGTSLTPGSTQGTTIYYVTEIVNGCESPASLVTITINNCCDLTVSTLITDETCDDVNDGAIDFTVGGSGTYDVIVGGTTEFNDVGAGTYNLTAQADGGYAIQVVDINDPSCDTTFNITINPGTLVTVISESSTDITDCLNPDGTFTVNSNGTSFELFTAAGGSVATNATGVFNGLNAGDYYVVVSIGGCTAQTATLTIVNASAPIAPTAGVDATYCQGDAMIDLTAAAGSGGTLNWYSDGGLTTNIGGGTTLAPGTTIGSTIYYVTETVAGCESPATPITITINAIPSAPLVGTDATYCQGDAMIDLTATASSGGTLNWYSDAGLSINIGTGITLAPNNTLGATTYFVTESVGTCESASSSVTITINATPTITAEVATDLTSCISPDGTVVVTANGTSYELFTAAGVSVTANATGSFTGLGVGSYFVVVSNGTCSVTGATLVVVDQTSPSSSIVNNSVCSGDSYTFADGVTSTNITTNETRVSTLINTVGCDSVVTENVTVVQPVTVVVDTTMCEGSNYTSVGDAASFTNVLNDFTHTSVLVGQNGCDSTIIENITVTPSASVDLGPDLNSCFGESITITATSNSGIPIWSTGDTSVTITFTTTVDTFFIVGVSGICGVATDTIFINVLPPPDVDAGIDQTIPLGAQAQLEATSSVVPVDFTWSPFTSLSCENCPDPLASPIATTTYIVTGTDENGCTASDTVTIIIDGEIEVYIPNVFSPNGDGENDLFRVYGPIWRTYNMKIYNRWGGLVFESNDANIEWDGSKQKNGEPVPQAVFVYKFYGVSIVGMTFEKAGNVMLAR